MLQELFKHDPNIMSKAQEQAYNAAPEYFQIVHDILPEPFFNTQAFLLFFLGFFAIYWMIPRRRQMARIWVLIAASFHFYAAWSFELAFLVTGTTVADYLFGRLMDFTQRQGLRRTVMLTSITMNLGILCYFKYRGFFLNELHDALTNFGYDPGYGKLDLFGLIVPFGISFYTFEAISYAVDVFRRKIPAENELPALSAVHPVLPAPGRRADRAGRGFPAANAPAEALELGSRCKSACSSSSWACSRRWPSPTAWPCSAIRSSTSRSKYNTGAVWMAVLAYAIRIYCDFSGYTDMAIGPAHLLGYKLDEQLQHAVSVGERRRVLAALAHLAVDLAARLPVHSAGRQPRQSLADLPQPDDHHDARRPVARGGMELRALGRGPRHAAHRA